MIIFTNMSNQEIQLLQAQVTKELQMRRLLACRQAMVNMDNEFGEYTRLRIHVAERLLAAEMNYGKRVHLVEEYLEELEILLNIIN